MVIDTSTLLKHITEVNAKKRQAAIDEKNRLKETLRSDLKTILSIVKDIKPFSKIADLASKDSPLFTEAFYHKLGFSSSNTNFFGACGGGFSGNSFFVNLKTKKFSVCGWYDESKCSELTVDQVVEKYYNDGHVAAKAHMIATKFPEYAEMASNYVMSLR